MTGTSSTPSSPIHWSTISCSGGSFTLTRTLASSASWTYAWPNSLAPNVESVIASTGPYTLSVDPEPYKYHHETPVALQSGELDYTWDWLSTDGNVNDLGNCQLYENVDWPGGSTYNLPSPPCAAGSSEPNPSFSGIGTMASGTATDHLRPPTDGFLSPYVAATWVGTQTWYFNDTTTSQTAIVLEGPSSITRNVYNFAPPNGWKYTVQRNSDTPIGSLVLP